MSLLLLLCALPLAACGTGGASEDTAAITPDTEDETTQPQPVFPEIVEDGKAVFRIVYPEGPGTVVFAAVTKLKEAIKEQTGVTLETTDDFLRWDQTRDDEAYEILVGATNYEQSAEVLSELRLGDYAIRLLGNKLVIVAHSDDDVSRAVNYFCKNFIEGKALGEDGKKTLYAGEYTYMTTPAVESLKIAGVGIEEFKIVYSTSTEGYRAAADKLAEYISERCGYVLEVTADGDADVAEHEILIGETDRAEYSAFAGRNETGLLGFAMGVEDGRFIMVAEPYTASLAVQRFSARYLYSGSPNVEIQSGEVFADSYLTTKSQPVADGARLRIMTANILAEFESWGSPGTVYDRAEVFAAVLETYAPDVAGIQEITAQWDEMIPYYSSESYEFVYMKTPDGLINYSTIIYKKDRLSVVDSGVSYFGTNGKNNIRLVTWGLFEVTESGERFLVFNTHWSWESEETARQQAREQAELMAQITSKYDYPYFCTGDFNTKQLTENYNLFLELTGAVDAKYAASDAGVLLNTSGGCGSVGVPRGEGGNSIDHIFMSPEVKIYAFATVVGNNTWDLSDHSPKYADISLD